MLAQIAQAASQAPQIAQAAMNPKDWWTLALTACFTLLAAFGAAGLTLWRQRRNQKFDAKLNLFLTLMMYRKANPPNQAWVNGLNIIDVIFYDCPPVLASWHKFFDILNDKNKVGSDEHTREYITLLTEMADDLNYKKLKWTEIDKFYSPQVYAEQAQTNAQMQSNLISFFQTATAALLQKQGENPVEEEEEFPTITVEIVSPEDNEYVSMKHQVSGYVLPSGAAVQVLVFSGNNLWYPQTPILSRATKWQVRATFGDEKSAERSYKLIAIVSATEIKGPVKDLPEDAVKSDVVIVTRAATQTPPPR